MTFSGFVAFLDPPDPSASETLARLAGAGLKVKILSGDPDSKGKSLRIGLEPGGCSGFQYSFAFDTKKAGDAEVSCDGFSVLIGPEAAPHLQSSTVDYAEDATSAGFKISNPNVKKSCGCGQSNSF